MVGSSSKPRGVGQNPGAEIPVAGEGVLALTDLSTTRSRLCCTLYLVSLFRVRFGEKEMI